MTNLQKTYLVVTSQPKSPETRELQESESFLVDVEMTKEGVHQRRMRSEGEQRSSWPTWEGPAQEQAPVIPLTKKKSTDLFAERYAELVLPSRMTLLPLSDPITRCRCI